MNRKLILQLSNLIILCFICSSISFGQKGGCEIILDDFSVLQISCDSCNYLLLSVDSVGTGNHDEVNINSVYIDKINCDTIIFVYKVRTYYGGMIPNSVNSRLIYLNKWQMYRIEAKELENSLVGFNKTEIKKCGDFGEFGVFMYDDLHTHIGCYGKYGFIQLFLSKAISSKISLSLKSNNIPLLLLAFERKDIGLIDKLIRNDKVELDLPLYSKYGKFVFFEEELNKLVFEIDSDDYKLKMQLIEFLENSAGSHMK